MGERCSPINQLNLSLIYHTLFYFYAGHFCLVIQMPIPTKQKPKVKTYA